MVEIPEGGIPQLRREAAPGIIAKLVEMEKSIINAICALQEVERTGLSPDLQNKIPKVGPLLRALRQKAGSAEDAARRGCID
jgi:hypothetical protein